MEKPLIEKTYGETYRETFNWLACDVAQCQYLADIGTVPHHTVPIFGRYWHINTLDLAMHHNATLIHQMWVLYIAGNFHGVTVLLLGCVRGNTNNYFFHEILETSLLGKHCI